MGFMWSLFLSGLSGVWQGLELRRGLCAHIIDTILGAIVNITVEKVV